MLYQGVGVGFYFWLAVHSLVGQLGKLWGGVWPLWQYLPGPIKQTLGEGSGVLLGAESPLRNDPSGGVFMLYIHSGSNPSPLNLVTKLLLLFLAFHSQAPMLLAPDHDQQRSRTQLFSLSCK